MKSSLLAENSNEAVQLLRFRFAGILDDVMIANDEESKLADFLTSEGVLRWVRWRTYRMTSAYVDAFIRRVVLPSRYPNAPTEFPPNQDDLDVLHIPEVLITCLKFYDRSLMELAPTRSFKSSANVRVGGHCGVPVARESVYDTECMRILSNWLSPNQWTVTGQWHLQGPGHANRYTDIVLQKGDRKPIVLELLATGSKAIVQSHIDKNPEYMSLLSAAEGWVVHFTREDDYTPLWQTDALLADRLNVMHISHDSTFKHLSVKARWKDIKGDNKYYTCDLEL